MLIYLDEVARAGTIRRAAERLGIAASSINRQIIALEDALGTPLFERMPRQMRLTAAGELMIAHVRQTLRAYEAVQAQLADLQGRRSGLVRLATMGGIATSLLPGVVTWMRERHPLVKLTIQVLSRDAIIAAVVDGDADLGLAYQLPADPKLRTLARAGLRLGAVVAPGHPLAAKRAVSLGDCAGYPMIIPDRSVTLGALMADALERSAVAVDTVIETNAIELLKAAVLTGHAVSFLNEMDVQREVRAGTLEFLPLPEGQVSRQELRLVQRIRGGLDAAQSVLAEHLREVVQGLEA
jgi:DNA-binding transcriptional LysR family regulator